MKADPVKLVRAEEAIRLWPKDHDIKKLEFKGISSQNRVKPSCYRFETDDQQAFDVDPDSGEVIRWHDNVYKYENGSTPGAKRMTNQEVDEISKKFLQQHYPKYKEDQLQSLVPGMMYRRKLENGVLDCGLSIRLSVDNYTGKVFGYELFRRQDPVYISTSPKISGKEAEAITLSVLIGLPPVKKFQGVLASAFIEKNVGLSLSSDSLGLQLVAWNLIILATEKPNYTYADYLKEKESGTRTHGISHYVSVDAHTGELIFLNGYEFGGVIPGFKKKASQLGAQQNSCFADHVALYERLALMQGEEYADTFFPPLLINDQPYLYVRVVAALLGKKVLTEDDKHIVINGYNPIEFYTNSSQFKAGNKVDSFDGKPINLFGRIYIPLKAIEKAFGVTPKWTKSSSRVVFPSIKQ